MQDAQDALLPVTMPAPEPTRMGSSGGSTFLQRQITASFSVQLRSFYMGVMTLLLGCKKEGFMINYCKPTGFSAPDTDNFKKLLNWKYLNLTVIFIRRSIRLVIDI